MTQRPNVVISSTARDLPEHRKQVGSACERIGYFPLPMENLPAAHSDAVRVSLELVNQANIYLGIFAHRYGHVPNGATKSITEMEYDRAVERGLPCLVFFMHDDHPIKASDVETGPSADALRRFKEQLATRHVVGFFKSADDLRAQVIHALASLKQPEVTSLHHVSEIPAPPEVYTAHPYTLLQTRQLVGRQAELNLLTDWVASPTSEVFAARVLCLVALGGMGKSALTWKWFQDIAPQEMKGLAGRLWWSFYESDAGFDNFLIRALAYVSRRSRQEVEDLPRPEIESQLLRLLQREPFLIVLDGLERVQVAYARFDAAHISDDDLDRETDNRLGGPAEVTAPHRLRKMSDPRAGHFLRQLSQLKESRILVSTRLYPAELQNAAGQALAGCHPYFLTGLSDDDALSLWRNLGVSGARENLLPLFRTFASHPLLVQTLAGAIANYRPAPGDFATWQRDHADFDPFCLPLTQVKTHVLQYALLGLAETPRAVLESIAGFRMPASYETLAVLHAGRSCSNPDALHLALEELEDRGLLGWDRQANRYDLHPIVRGVTWGSLSGDARVGIYESLTAHFESLPYSRYMEVKRIEDLAPAIELFNSLVGLRRYPDALSVFSDRLDGQLLHSLGAMRERTELLELLLPAATDPNPALSDINDRAYVWSSLAFAYDLTGHPCRGESLHWRTLDLPRVRDRDVALFLAAQNLLARGHLHRAELLLRELIAWEIRSQGSVRDLTTISDTLKEVWDLRGSPNLFAALDEDAQQEWRQPITIHLNRIQSLVRLLPRWRGTKSANEDAVADLLKQSRDQGLVEEELVLLNVLAECRHRRGDSQGVRTLLGDLWQPAEAGPFPLILADANNLLATLERNAGNPSGAADAALRAYRYAWCDGPPFAHQLALNTARDHLSALGFPAPELPPFDPARFPLMPELNFSTKPDPLFDSEDDE